MKGVRIYTHGACSEGPGPGGYAAVLLRPDGIFEFACHAEETNRNRVKIISVIEALNAVPEGSEIRLFTASKYVVNAISLGWIDKWLERGWRKRDGERVLDVDLWTALLDALRRHASVKVMWLHGHGRNAYSDHSDVLARDAMTGREAALRPSTLGQRGQQTRYANFASIRF